MEPILGAEETELRGLARRAQELDPRVSWLAEEARRWKEAGEKTLVFTARRETLEALRTALSRLSQIRTGAFHEDMSPGQRDIEVAQFRQPAGPHLLISTECGGEGRNFEFCRRLVLFDLPWSPSVVEQRIGRLDRIGRESPVEIVYFRPPHGLGAAVARLYEAVGLLIEPLGGLDRALAHIERTIEAIALAGSGPIPLAAFNEAVAEARVARTRVQAAAYRELHRDPFRPEMAGPILERVPRELEPLTEEVILAACERLGFHVEPQRGDSTYLIEFGGEALVETLPGVPGGSRFLGTFSREEAVRNETLDFFASGHPLVEGILAQLGDSERGRVALLQAYSTDEEGFGLLALYKTGPRFEAVAVDSEGCPRPDWARLLTRRPLRTRRVKLEGWSRTPGWSATLRRLASQLGRSDRPVAAAVFWIARRSRATRPRAQTPIE